MIVPLLFAAAAASGAGIDKKNPLIWGLVGLGVGVALELALKKSEPKLRTLGDKEAAEASMKALEGSGPPERNLLRDPPSQESAGSVMAELRVRLAKRGVKLTPSQESEMKSTIPMLLAGGVV